jgi:hypothetical protein
VAGEIKAPASLPIPARGKFKQHMKKPRPDQMAEGGWLHNGKHQLGKLVGAYAYERIAIPLDELLTVT